MAAAKYTVNAIRWHPRMNHTESTMDEAECATPFLYHTVSDHHDQLEHHSCNKLVTCDDGQVSNLLSISSSLSPSLLESLDDS